MTGRPFANAPYKSGRGRQTEKHAAVALIATQLRRPACHDCLSTIVLDGHSRFTHDQAGTVADAIARRCGPGRRSAQEGRYQGEG
jgi:hypothetical protein